MNILIVGRGWVGNKMYDELTRRNHTVRLCGHIEVFTINDQFDWVVNCAGITGTPNVDACELDKNTTLSGNAVFPLILYMHANRIGAKFAHFSSGCIYEGTINDVHELPNFFGSTYSISKGISDVALRDVGQIYRIRMPFTDKNEQKNYLTKILKYANTGKLIEGGKNSLTDLNEAVAVACDLIEINAPYGPYNLVNNGAITMHELVDMLGVNPQWYTDEEFIQATAARRSNCVIPAYEKMSHVTDALKKAITSLNTN